MRDDHHPERVVGAEVLLRGEREVAHVVERVDAGVDAAAPHDLPQAAELEGRELVARDGLHGVVDDWVRVGGRGHGITLTRAGPRVVSTRVLILRDATTVPRCLRSSSDRSLRYVDDRVGDDLGADRRRVRGRDPRRPRARPGASTACTSRSSRSRGCRRTATCRTRCASTASSSGREPGPRRFPPSTIRLADPRAARSTSCSARAASPGRTSRPTSCARTSTRTGQGIDALRAYALRLADRRRRRGAAPTCCSCSATRSTPTSPRRRCSEQFAARERPRRRAGGRAGRLPRVRPGLPRGVVGAGDPLAVLDGPGDDGLRRPRDPRRVADLAGLAGRDERRAVVRRPHPRRADGLLGVPAPRQPLARGARGAAGCYDEVRAAGDAAELLAARMDTEGRQIGHSRWSFARDARRRAARRHRLARRARRHARAGASSIQRRGVGLDPRAGAASRPGTCCSPARCRSCWRPACTTSRRSTRR